MIGALRVSKLGNCSDDHEFVLNPFLVNAPIEYPLKIPENLQFSGVFKEYKLATLPKNEYVNGRNSEEIRMKPPYMEDLFF